LHWDRVGDNYIIGMGMYGISEIRKLVHGHEWGVGWVDRYARNGDGIIGYLRKAWVHDGNLMNI
jgi:hypothetical protein